MLPNFVIIGAAKCATTTLSEYLRRHPQIVFSRPKEPDFFSQERNYARGESWYRSLFRCGDEVIAYGEASTTYTRLPRFPCTVDRMPAMIPDTRLIYIMRHPVDRTYSHYRHNLKRGGDFL